MESARVRGPSPPALAEIRAGRRAATSVSPLIEVLDLRPGRRLDANWIRDVRPFLEAVVAGVFAAAGAKSGIQVHVWVSGPRKQRHRQIQVHVAAAAAIVEDVVEQNTIAGAHVVSQILGEEAGMGAVI